MNRKRLIIWLLLIGIAISGCSVSRSHSKSVNKIHGSSSSWTGEKRTELELEAGQTVTFQFQSKLDSGELSIRLFDPHNNLIHDFEIGIKGKTDQNITESGTHMILISGKEFRGSYELEW